MDDREVTPDLEADAAWIAAALLLTACLGGAILMVEWPLWGVSAEEPQDPHLVEPSENGTQLWPYTATARDYETRTLGLNMVFFGNQSDIHTALTERSELEWEAEQLHEGDAESDTISPERVEINPDEELGNVISMEPAGGSARYTYYERNGERQWADAAYQLHAGTYLGKRTHVRAYEDPQGEWTAMQVHDEHWDWFRLRHTVTGLSDAQRELEQDFIDEPYVDSVIRMPFNNDTGDADGWASGIRLAGLALVVGILGSTGRARREVTEFLGRRQREFALGGAIFALYTAVRWVGVAAELVFPNANPHTIGIPIYIGLSLGVPAVAYGLGTGSDRTWAFTLAAAGLGGAFVLDFVLMDVAVLPIRFILHRVAVLLAVGLIAVGGALATTEQKLPTPFLVGFAGWVAALVAPVVGII